jgi:hypothetical protein
MGTFCPLANSLLLSFLGNYLPFQTEIVDTSHSLPPKYNLREIRHETSVLEPVSVG